MQLVEKPEGTCPPTSLHCFDLRQSLEVPESRTQACSELFVDFKFGSLTFVLVTDDDFDHTSSKNTAPH